MAAAANSPEKKDEIYEITPSRNTVHLICKSGKKLTETQCEKKYADDHGFTIIETDDDGNCFYHSLQKFSEKAKYELLKPVKKIPLRHQIRIKLVMGMLSAYKKNSMNFLTKGINNSEIEKLLEHGVYNCDAGDLQFGYVSSIFHVNLIIHSFNYANKTVEVLTYTYNTNPNTPNVHLLHSGEHYRLLWPKILKNNITLKKKSAASASSNSNSNSSSKSSSRSSSKSPNNTVVYVNSTGKVYHLFENDAGQIYKSMSKNDAVKLGKTLCKKCEKRKQSTRKSNNNSNNSNNELQQALAESLGKSKM